MTVFFNDAYAGKSVFLTGHTGFKGSWLSLWLRRLGATVSGLSISAPTSPSHWALLNLSIEHDFRLNVASYGDVLRCLRQANPEIVFHMAAQPLVLQSYADPMETVLTNVMGTLNLLEAVRHVPSVKAVVIVTTDKCYQNDMRPVAYAEADPLGGNDLYSASKTCAEVLTHAYRKSFFETSGIAIASCRGGNVVGGGDWGVRRLIPDLVQSGISGDPVSLRYPNAIRPWQHVLDCLSGYLVVGEHLLRGIPSANGAWNVGPLGPSTFSVMDVVNVFSTHWRPIHVRVETGSLAHEEVFLSLDATKLHRELHWSPVLDFESSIRLVAEWTKAYVDSGVCLSEPQLSAYLSDAVARGCAWAKKA